MKIGELAKRSGLSAHTIRYYERIGLLPYAHRDAARQRDYDASILTWIEFLGRLKTTGMPIREMLRYAALRQKGAGTEAERRALLERHRDSVDRRVVELQNCLLALDSKIAGYAKLKSRRATDGKAHSGTVNDKRSNRCRKRKPLGARSQGARPD